MAEKIRKKVYIKTYGCQMNVYDSQKMVDLLRPLGYEPVETPEGAHMVILNTCHIREKATEKVYSDLGRIKPYKDQNKDMIVAVAGCVAQAEGAEILKRAPYVDMVFGPQTYHRLPEMIAQAIRQKELTEGSGRGILDVEFPVESKFDHLPVSQDNGASSAFLTIQEGCDKFCRFCCVPYTRGAEFSRPVQAILKEAQELVDQGVLEITLLGQNVNAYHGLDSRGQEWGLGRLLFALAEIQGLKRLRYTTSHPRDVDEELIQAHGEVDILMPYLHLPVQSGSDRMLKEMNRKHTRDFYLNIIEKLRKARPGIAFSSDFIVGYPGESDKDFEETLDLVERVKFSQAYSFKYSRRPGTPASAIEFQVAEPIKVERLRQLQDLLRSHQISFNKTFIGSTLPVLLEKKGKHEGQLIGKSPYLQSVHVMANDRLKGHIVDVVIGKATLNSLSGDIHTGEYDGILAS